MEYEYQESKWTAKRFELTDDGLVYSSTKEEERKLPYDRIKRVVLLAPMGGLYLCRVEPREGKSVAMVSRAFVSLGEFQDLRDQYVPFVRELHRRLADRPDIEYKAGSSEGFYIIGVGMPVLALLVILVAALALATGRRVPISLFVGMAIVIPIGLNFLRKGRAIKYEPDDLPGKYLGLE